MTFTQRGDQQKKKHSYTLKKSPSPPTFHIVKTSNVTYFNINLKQEFRGVL